MSVPPQSRVDGKQWLSDFLIRLRDPASTGPDDLLTLVLEVTGEASVERSSLCAPRDRLWTTAIYVEHFAWPRRT